MVNQPPRCTKLRFCGTAVLLTTMVAVGAAESCWSDAGVAAALAVACWAAQRPAKKRTATRNRQCLMVFREMTPHGRATRWPLQVIDSRRFNRARSPARVRFCDPAVRIRTRTVAPVKTASQSDQESAGK